MKTPTNDPDSNNRHFPVRSVGLLIILIGLAVGGLVVLNGASKSENSPTTTTPRPPVAAAVSDTTGINLSVETADIGRPISQYIYGMDSPDPDYMQRLGVTLNRWGGNPASRYNWELGNAWNASRDYFFANTDYNIKTDLDRQPGGAPDKFVQENKKAGVVSLITIPALGYVARNNDGATRSQNVPKEGGPALNPTGAIKDYDPVANRQLTSLPILPTKPGPLQFPPDATDRAVYADEWLNHLVTKFGPAGSGGVRFYTVDNEPDLWASTHTDVHPALPGYDEILQKYLDFASAIHRQDPTAKITGPAFSSPARISYSPLDDATGQADRKAHGNQPLLEWWLNGVHDSDLKNGRRTLDVLDLHYYPGGNLYFGADNNDPALRSKRLEATRALWDPTFQDESTGTTTALLPTMHALVDRNYPGTGIGLGEWNFGGEKDISGGLATADALGIFGEQDLYYASYWNYPPENSPSYFAFKMFGNYDDQGGRYGDRALSASSSDRAKVAFYAARRTGTNSLTMLAVNKTPDAQTVKLNLKNLPAGSYQARLWQYAQANLNGIQTLPTLPISQNRFDFKLAGYSITLWQIDDVYGSKH